MDIHSEDTTQRCWQETDVGLYETKEPTARRDASKEEEATEL